MCGLRGIGLAGNTAASLPYLDWFDYPGSKMIIPNKATPPEKFHILLASRKIVFHSRHNHATMTTLKLHSEPLQDTWLDAYGHLNEAYYLVAFSNASWFMQDHFGIGVDYFKDTGCAMYTVETHIRYLMDVRAPAQLDIETIILGADAKRIWFAHQMMVENTLRATGEFMTLHYHTKENHTTPMPEPIQSALQKAKITNRPEWISRRISLDR